MIVNQIIIPEIVRNDNFPKNCVKEREFIRTNGEEGKRREKERGV